MRKTIRENPDTLKGKLQRGHGAGYLEALQTPPEELAPVLFDCIYNDARLDRQVESRCEYYASLINQAQIDISPVADFLKANDDTHDDGNRLLAIDTLGNLSSSGHEKATVFLRDYISYGYNWCAAISELVETGHEINLIGLDDVICSRYKNDDDLLRDIDKQSLDCGFFEFLKKANSRLKKLTESSKLQDWTHSVKQKVKSQKSAFRDISLFEAFERCERDNFVGLSRTLESKLSSNQIPFLEKMVQDGNDPQKALAMTCLGAIGTSESFIHLKHFLEVASNGFIENPDYEKKFICAAAIRNCANAPAEVCLEIGRKWFVSANYPENVAGWCILEKYAMPEDIPMLKQAIVDALNDEDENAYWLCSAIDALGNFGNVGMIGEVEKAYHETVYSYARRRAAQTMSINVPLDFSANYAYECLYDCEDGTKLLGIEFANVSVPAVYQRLSELAEDPLEDERVRKEAKERLF